MKDFLGDNFLLTNRVAEELYHDYAKSQPIIDYHCHLSPEDVNVDRKFDNLTEAWLEGDHYKWRAMRTCGVDENYITGNKPDNEKFLHWAKIVPKTIRNPLYHWTHLELRRYFCISELLDHHSGSSIYDNANAQLRSGKLSCQSILKKMKVEVVCTTDDPIDDLNNHREFSSDALVMLPTFRPDKAYSFHDLPAYKDYLARLESATSGSIEQLQDLIDALSARINFFAETGGKLADHGLECIPAFNGNTDPEKSFKKVLDGSRTTNEELEELRYTILKELGRLYHTKGWTQQFHLGALRNNSSRMMSELGPDTGFDSIGDFSQAKSLARFLDDLDSTGKLAKTIIYNLNPSDNEVISTMIGNFNDGSVAGKMQFGSAWWFLDQKDGMEKQINALSTMGMLSQFVGMLTDSRSFLSFPRHEYFRRILCNMIGTDVVNGELPNDIELLGGLVSDVCYNNAKRYFQF